MIGRAKEMVQAKALPVTLSTSGVYYFRVWAYVTISNSPYNYQPWYRSKNFKVLSSLSQLAELLKGPMPTLTKKQRENMIRFHLSNAICNTLSIYVRTMGVESAIHDDADIIMRFGFNGLLNRSISHELQYTHPTDGHNPVRNFCDGNPDSQRKNVPDNNRDLDDLCTEAILEDILREFSGFVLPHRQMCCPESGAAYDGSAYDDDTDPDGVNDNDGPDRKARPPNKQTPRLSLFCDLSIKHGAALPSGGGGIVC